MYRERERDVKHPKCWVPMCSVYYDALKDSLKATPRLAPANTWINQTQIQGILYVGWYMIYAIQRIDVSRLWTKTCVVMYCTVMHSVYFLMLEGATTNTQTLMNTTDKGVKSLWSITIDHASCIINPHMFYTSARIRTMSLQLHNSVLSKMSTEGASCTFRGSRLLVRWNRKHQQAITHP